MLVEDVSGLHHADVSPSCTQIRGEDIPPACWWCLSRAELQLLGSQEGLARRSSHLHCYDRFDRKAEGLDGTFSAAKS